MAIGMPFNKYTVTIHWGDSQTRQETLPIEYNFDSIEERNSFMEGVREAIGYTDYEFVDES